MPKENKNIEEVKQETLKRIEECKKQTQKETGSFKYDFCYDEAIKIIKEGVTKD